MTARFSPTAGARLQLIHGVVRPRPRGSQSTLCLFLSCVAVLWACSAEADEATLDEAETGSRDTVQSTSAAQRAERVPDRNSLLRTEWSDEESITIGWNKSGEVYRLIVEYPLRNWDADDVENSPRLRIQTPDSVETILTLPGGIVPKSHGPMDTLLWDDNLIDSEYLYMTPRFRSANDLAALMIFGWAFASEPGGLLVVQLDPLGHPFVVFHAETFGVLAFDDVDSDGYPEMIGIPTLARRFGVRGLKTGISCPATTYNPRAVYRMPRSGCDTATYDLSLGESYNQEYYYGWAGPDWSDDPAVILCPGETPKVMMIEDAERLLNSRTPGEKRNRGLTRE